MWILSVRADHVRRRAAQCDREPVRHRHRRSDDRKYLPLRHVRAHPASRASRRTADAGRTAMKLLVALWWILVTVAGTLATNLSATVQREESARAFDVIASVLPSPRCANCHIVGDRLTTGEMGRPHAMAVRRGKDGRGAPAMRCTNCHQEASVPAPHAPPGARDWRLPPPATPMAWKDLPAREQCRVLKDPSKNGGKTVPQLLEHGQHDPLVLGGWSPGPERMPPPISHDAFVNAVRTWIDLGAACPQ